MADWALYEIRFLMFMRILLHFCFAIALVACNSKSGRETTGPVAATTGPGFRSIDIGGLRDEFGSLSQPNYGLALLRADGENARLYDGSGIDIGIIDTPIFLRSPELRGRNIQSVGGIAPVNGFITEGLSHGTAVTSIIAARRDGQGIRGVAPAARFFSYSINAGTADNIYEPSLVEAADGVLRAVFAGFTAPFNAMIRNNIDVVNVSLGLSNGGLIEYYTPSHLRREIARTVGIFRQASPDGGGMNLVAGRRTVFVIAAGNDNRRKWGEGYEGCCGGRGAVADADVNASSPSLLAGLPLYFPNLRGIFVAVAAVDRDRRIAPFSNQCGSDSTEWCIAAPGYRLATASGNELLPYAEVSGTSFAAPYVTGGIALVMQAFSSQNITPEASVQRILNTANRNFGDYDEKVYGAGIIDLEAALTPIPPVSLIGSGWSSPLSAASMRSSPAIGDALSRNGHTLTFFDSLATAFHVPLATRISRPLSRFLEDFPTTHQPAIMTIGAMHFRQQASIDAALTPYQHHRFTPALLGSHDAFANPYLNLIGRKNALSIARQIDSRYGTTHIAFHTATNSPPNPPTPPRRRDLTTKTLRRGLVSSCQNTAEPHQPNRL